MQYRFGSLHGSTSRDCYLWWYLVGRTHGPRRGYATPFSRSLRALTRGRGSAVCIRLRQPWLMRWPFANESGAGAFPDLESASKVPPPAGPRDVVANCGDPPPPEVSTRDSEAAGVDREGAAAPAPISSSPLRASPLRAAEWRDRSDMTTEQTLGLQERDGEMQGDAPPYVSLASACVTPPVGEDVHS